MAASRWPVVAAALVAALDTTGDLAGIVFDGIPVTADQLPDAVFVGVVLDEDTGDAGSLTHAWHELGEGAPVDENGSIRCTAVSQRGDTDLAAARDAAFTLLAVCEDTVRDDPTLGIGELLDALVDTGRIRQGQTPQGCFCEVEWTLRYRALI